MSDRKLEDVMLPGETHDAFCKRVRPDERFIFDGGKFLAQNILAKMSNAEYWVRQYEPGAWCARDRDWSCVHWMNKDGSTHGTPRLNKFAEYGKEWEWAENDLRYIARDQNWKVLCGCDYVMLGTDEAVLGMRKRYREAEAYCKAKAPHAAVERQRRISGDVWCICNVANSADKKLLVDYDGPGMAWLALEKELRERDGFQPSPEKLEQLYPGVTEQFNAKLDALRNEQPKHFRSDVQAQLESIWMPPTSSQAKALIASLPVSGVATSALPRKVSFLRRIFRAVWRWWNGLEWEKRPVYANDDKTIGIDASKPIGTIQSVTPTHVQVAITRSTGDGKVTLSCGEASKTVDAPKWNEGTAQPIAELFGISDEFDCPCVRQDRISMYEQAPKGRVRIGKALQDDSNSDKCRETCTEVWLTASKTCDCRGTGRKP